MLYSGLLTLQKWSKSKYSDYMVTNIGLIGNFAYLINTIKIAYLTVELINYESEKKLWIGVKLLNLTPV